MKSAREHLAVTDETVVAAGEKRKPEQIPTEAPLEKRAATAPGDVAAVTAKGVSQSSFASDDRFAGIGDSNIIRDTTKSMDWNSV